MRRPWQQVQEKAAIESGEREEREKGDRVRRGRRGGDKDAVEGSRASHARTCLVPSIFE
jgi:hypothetical protein